jgi:hypothetical protein
MNARSEGNSELESLWRYKQENIPSTPLPLNFPYRSELAAAGYTTMMDLDGADVPELRAVGKLRRLEAESVVEAYALIVAEAAATS